MTSGADAEDNDDADDYVNEAQAETKLRSMNHIEKASERAHAMLGLMRGGGSDAACVKVVFVHLPFAGEEVRS